MTRRHVLAGLILALVVATGASGAPPPVQSVTITATSIVIARQAGTKTLVASSIPSSNNTVAKIETFVNAWAAANIRDCQVRVHVFSLKPLVWTVGTWDVGETIPNNWWVSE